MVSFGNSILMVVPSTFGLSVAKIEAKIFFPFLLSFFMYSCQAFNKSAVVKSSKIFTSSACFFSFNFSLCCFFARILFKDNPETFFGFSIGFSAIGFETSC